MLLNVLQVNKLYHPYIGGVENIVRQYAENLNSRVNMRVLVCRDRGFKSVESVNGVSVTRSTSLGILNSMPVAPFFPCDLRAMSQSQDILHFHMPFPLGDISYLLNRIRARVIVSWHSDIVRQRFIKKIYSPLMHAFLRKVDRIIVATPRHIASSEVLQQYESKCTVIPFGIDTGKYCLNDTAQKQVSSIRARYNGPIALFVGRLVYYKGIEVAIRAMEYVDGTLLVIGKGPLEKKLRAVAAEKNISHKIHFLGAVSDQELPLYYSACDIFIFPSIANSEAFGIVQLEAMACSKPVINTNLPTGVPWVSRDRETGITVPPFDVEALADAMNRLFSHDEIRLQYGINAFRRVQDVFSVERMMQDTLNLYHETIHGSSHIPNR